MKNGYILGIYETWKLPFEEMFYKVVAPKTSVKLTGKHLFRSPHFSNVAGKFLRKPTT